MRLERRLRALEARMSADPVILHFADGSTRNVNCRNDVLFSLFRNACGGNLSPEEAAQLDLIRQSVAADEPGGGHMIELLRALLAGSGEG